MGVRDELNMQQDALLSQCRLNGNIVDLKKRARCAAQQGSF